MSEFYAYLWLRSDGTPYYVGKGKGHRAFTTTGHLVNRPTDSSRIVILERASEAEAFATEKELIANWGRKDAGTGCLWNRTDGGDAPPSALGKQYHFGKMHTMAARAKMSRIAKTVANSGRFQIGHSVSEAFRENVRERMIGNKNGRALKGRPWSEARRTAYERNKFSMEF